jgi:hypothetical protein
MKTFLDAIDAVAMVILALGGCLLGAAFLMGLADMLHQAIDHPTPWSAGITIALLLAGVWMWGRKDSCSP